MSGTQSKKQAKKGEKEETSEEKEINVLHVDDSSEFVEMAAIYLEKNNEKLNVETEVDPVEALKRIQEEEYDCIISDCSMPGMKMDGMELRSAVRENFPEVPFVFFTGTPISEFPNETMSDEETGHMRKEVDSKQFSNLASWISETVE